MQTENKSYFIRWYLKHKDLLFYIFDMILTIICFLTPRKRLILMESKPDYSDNTYEVYKNMIEHDINQQYKIIWLVDNYISENNIYDLNVESYPIYPEKRTGKIKLRYLMNKADCIVCSHRFVFPYFKRKSQVFVYLDHGSPLKDCKEIYQNSIKSNAYYIAQSEFFADSIVDQYSIPLERIIPLGLPRNDQLFKKYNSLSRLIKDVEKYNKIILWAPTFRYHESVSRVDCHSDMPIGIPICYTEVQLQALNEYLLRMNTLLILKPHPAQNLDLILKQQNSNIIVLFKDDLINANIQTNELLAQTDALITDYSSIYYDYLLIDKPVAITLDDYEQYKAEMGFVFKEPLDVLKGAYIHNIDDLYSFIKSVVLEEDDYKEDRNKILRLVDKYHDCFSGKRVYDFIMDTLSK